MLPRVVLQVCNSHYARGRERKIGVQGQPQTKCATACLRNELKQKAEWVGSSGRVLVSKPITTGSAGKPQFSLKKKDVICIQFLGVRVLIFQQWYQNITMTSFYNKVKITCIFVIVNLIYIKQNSEYSLSSSATHIFLRSE
jgi:hypothetical protein